MSGIVIFFFIKIVFLICKSASLCYITKSNLIRRDGRAVEGAALEMLFRRNLNASSNLALSAIFIFSCLNLIEMPVLSQFCETC